MYAAVALCLLTSSEMVYDVGYPDIQKVKEAVAEIGMFGGALPRELEKLPIIDGIPRPPIVVTMKAMPDSRYYKLEMETLKPIGQLKYGYKTTELWVIDRHRIRVKTHIHIDAFIPHVDICIIGPIINRIIQNKAGPLIKAAEMLVLRKEKQLMLLLLGQPGIQIKVLSLNLEQMQAVEDFKEGKQNDLYSVVECCVLDRVGYPGRVQELPQTEIEGKKYYLLARPEK